MSDPNTSELTKTLQRGFTLAVAKLDAYQQRAEKAEAAIAEVLKICDTKAVVVHDGNGSGGSWWYGVDARAIDDVLSDYLEPK